jgi:hypothetical protein
VILQAAAARRVSLVVACTLIAAVAVAALASGRHTLYESTAAVAIGEFRLDPALGEVADLDPHFVVPHGGSIVTAQLPNAWLKTVDLAVASELGRKVGDVAKSVEVNLNANDRRLEFVASTRSPRTSARLANAYAERYIALDHQAYREQLASAEATVKLQTAIARRTSRGPTPTLRRQAEELTILQQAGARPLSLVSRAEPRRRVAGVAPWHEVLVGGLAGLMFGLTAAVVLDALRRPAALPSWLR